MKNTKEALTDTTCRSCGDEHQRQFCPRCGEKRFDPQALSIGHFFEETLEGLFHFDNKFLRTVRTLVRHPGLLSVDQVEGRRVGAVRPFQLFLIVNVLIFFLLFSNPFSIPLKNYITYRPFINYGTVELVQAHIAQAHTTMEAFGKDFDHAMHGASKSFLVLLIPVYALFFGLLLVNKRRRVVEHLIFATHYVTFTLVSFLVVVYLFLPLELVAEMVGANDLSACSDQAFTFIFSALFVVWLFFAIKRFYKAPMVHSLIVALLVGASYFWVLQFYRMVLFYGLLRTAH